MLNTVIRLFHSLVSLTPASGITTKAIRSREEVLHKPAELFWGKIRFHLACGRMPEL